MQQKHIRNVAIVAHVDHGKTTLVDKMLAQAGTFRANEHIEERVMDSNDLERERGITILAKNTSIRYNETTINIVDTPGHADFGGEVERILKMVDGVLLVVDAIEGCMPQTKFVLRKAMEAGLSPIIVVNKMDRPNARPLEVVDEVLNLLIELGGTEEQLEAPVVYASAIRGVAQRSPDEEGVDLKPLFDAIVEHIPCPAGDPSAPLQFQISTLDYSEYLGRIGIGRVQRGTIQTGQTVAVIHQSGETEQTRLSKLFGFSGLGRTDISSASVGDIIAVAGVDNISIGDTLTAPDTPEPLPFLKIDEPTLQMTFLVNDSPFAGREGAHVTSQKLRSRLFAETQTNVSLRVEETETADAFLVSGRGELHLAILIETMRREGYELQVSKPEVILREINGVRCEPFEHLVVDVPQDYMGAVMERLGERRGQMKTMTHGADNTARLEFIIPARGLIGFRTEFLTQTRGYGIMHHSFHEYLPYQGDLQGRRSGVLISSEIGVSTTYGMQSVEDRGVLFLEPGTEVYEGMIVGEHSREQDLTVNVCKTKQLTSIRSATKEIAIRLKAPRLLTLEQALEYLDEDEYCEVTPKSIRLRKRYLKKNERERAGKQPKMATLQP